VSATPSDSEVAGDPGVRGKDEFGLLQSIAAPHPAAGCESRLWLVTPDSAQSGLGRGWITPPRPSAGRFGLHVYDRARDSAGQVDLHARE
jgi:hypothetical protein